MSVPSESRAILLIYAEPPQHVPPPSPSSSSSDEPDILDQGDDEFGTWHDSVHVPALFNLTTVSNGTPKPLFLSCTRWAAADCKTPTHLSLYDLATPNVVRDPTYVGLTRDVFEKMHLIDRRVYVSLAHASAPPPTPPLNWDGWARRGEDLVPSDSDQQDFDEEIGHGRYMSVVEIEMQKFAEGEFNRWFDEEHIPLLMRVPGWVRSRRFALTESLGVSGTSVASNSVRWAERDGDSAETDSGRDVVMRVREARRKLRGEERPPKYLAVHEWSSLDAFSSKEFKRATSTPWRGHVLKEDRVSRYEMRVFRFAGSWTAYE